MVLGEFAPCYPQFFLLLFNVKPLFNSEMFGQKLAKSSVFKFNGQKLAKGSVFKFNVQQF